MYEDPLEEVGRKLRDDAPPDPPKVRSDNTSGYPGVYRRPSGKWCAELRLGNGKKRNLGTFANIDDAIAATQAAEDETGLG